MIFATFLLPSRCPVCRRRVGVAPRAGGRRDRGHGLLCDDCLADLPPPPALPPPPGADRCHAAVAYADGGRLLVGALKFRAERAAVLWVAVVLAAAVRAVAVPIDVVTWAPTTGRRARRRGGDHAERLARSLAAQLGVPCRRLLVRGPGPPQAGQGAAERRAGPRFTAARRAPPCVVLVDDVVTSGGTATAAAIALRRAGATRVVVACAARTPPPRRRARAP